MRVCGSRCPIFVFGLMRRAVAAQTRGMGAYIAADLVFVAELRLRGRFRRVPGALYFQRLHAPTPDVIARTRRAGDAAWFDPSRRRRRAALTPEVKLLVEMVRAIRESEVSGLDRVRFYVALGGHVATRGHRWCVLRAKRLRWQIWSMWSAVSRGCLRSARVTSLPLRCWALLSGVRRAQRDRLRAAVGGPWGRANPRLLAFGAERLHRRRDRGSMRLLIDWLLGPCRVRQQAAAGVLGPHADRYAPVVAVRLRNQPPERADAVVENIHAACGAGAAADWRNALAVASAAADDAGPVARALCEAED